MEGYSGKWWQQLFGAGEGQNSNRNMDNKIQDKNKEIKKMEQKGNIAKENKTKISDNLEFG